MTDSNEHFDEPTPRHPIDEEFLELKRKVQDLSQNLNLQEAENVKRWIIKLTGTSPKQRNEYVKCLLHQVELGKLLIPFTDIPEMFAALPPLHEALHGPIPDLNAPKTTTWRSGRGRIEGVKKLSHKELKAKYGTDRIGLHTCLKDITDIDDFTVQGLVGFTGPHTKDGGALMVKIMQEELKEFRDVVQTFYQQHSTVMSEEVAKEQIELKEAYRVEAENLELKRKELKDRLNSKDPEFDWNWFNNYNKVDLEQNMKLKKLRQQVVKQEEKNNNVREIIAELEQRLEAQNNQNNSTLN